MTAGNGHGEQARGNTRTPSSPIGDRAALALQQLYRDGRVAAGGNLLRIDNRADAAAAPFQFDAVNGMLHRRYCSAIPHSARTAVYGLWQIGTDERRRACPRCRPVPDDTESTETPERADLLFGLISVVDQFAGVLKERGKDYQHSTEGQKLSAQMGRFYRTLGQREKEVLDTVLLSLDLLVQRIRDIDTGLNAANGEDRKTD